MWLHARHGFHEIPWLTLIDAYEAADRRDAELMWVAQRNRFVGNICTDGDPLDWEFDVVVRVGLVRVYCPRPSPLMRLE